MGVGPSKAEAGLGKALCFVRPSLILLIGYAGALDPKLKLGEIVAVRPASLLAKTGPEAFTSGTARSEGTWDLPGTDAVAARAAAAGIDLPIAPGLTSHGVIGDAIHKSLLQNRFGASLIDMETAAVARVAQGAGVPAACVRAITDTAEDEFLKPFSFKAKGKRIRTHVTLLTEGEFLEYRKEWNRRTLTAREGLSRFLMPYLSSGLKE